VTGAVPAAVVVLVAVVALLGLNAATAFAYAVDKRAARLGRRRVPERTLLVLGLLGGWPAAQVARHVLRHKTRKASFRRAHRATVVVNVAGVAVLVALLLH